MSTRNPIEIFNQHWSHALENSPLLQKSAVCVSTIGEAGYPNSRFVDLKAADESGLVFCTYLDSAKGRDIARNPRVSLTAWWDHIGIQARFQGDCERISDCEADTHWSSRTRDAQLTTMTFRQSEPLDDPASMQERLSAARFAHRDKDIRRPPTWGGFRLLPVFIELLEFREDRLHVRTCYSKDGQVWRVSHLQP